MRYQSREAQCEKVLYYLREPPGEPPNTTFNEAILTISKKIFHTTSASLRAHRPILLLTEQYYFNGDLQKTL